MINGFYDALEFVRETFAASNDDWSVAICYDLLAKKIIAISVRTCDAVGLRLCFVRDPAYVLLACVNGPVSEEELEEILLDAGFEV